MEFDNLEPMPTTCKSNHATPYGAGADVLTVGKTYHVVSVEVSGFHSLLKLEEDGKWYNSVHFDFDLEPYFKEWLS